MSIYEFKEYVGIVTKDFRELLNELEGNKKVRQFLRDRYSKCTNDFEEEVLTEKLQEVYNEWIIGA